MDTLPHSTVESTTPFLNVLISRLPNEFLPLECLLTSSSRAGVETLLQFVLGGDCPAIATPETRNDWACKQPEVIRAVQGLLGPDLKSAKRTRENEDVDMEPNSKRPKTTQVNAAEDDDPTLFTLPSVSTSSPIRKKVDITVHTRSIQFINPSSRTVEASILLSNITRAFILPTRGKAKGHWTIVLLCSDTPPEKGKAATGAQHQQVIFGLDAFSTTGFETTSYSFFTKASGHTAHGSTSATTTTETIAKGAETRSSLEKLLSFLPVPFFEPSSSVFRSACASANAGDGAAGINAYLSAKSGTLWFFDRGILWGESKPCEFWDVENLVARDGVRLLSATGRTCSVILRRRRSAAVKSGDGDDDEDEVEEDLSETEFTMVDGKEQDPIYAWARQRKHLFGKPSAATSGPSQISSKESIHPKSRPAPTSANGPAWDDSDPEDEDFETESSESASSGSDESEKSDNEQDDGSEDVNNSGDEDDEEQEGGDEEEFEEPRHPVLQRDPVRVSTSMVMNAFSCGLGSGASSEEDELEED
ncbi:hypothetical protein V8B97DRAFT_1966637 [Scleroderma yunnanense]